MQGLKCQPTVSRAAVSRARVVRVSCQKGAIEQVQVAAASVFAAAILASPASAGVVLQQPELKKVFQSDAAPAAPVKREFKGFSLGVPSAPKPAADKKAEAAAPKPKAAESSEGSDLDPRSVALPGALAVVVGGFFAARAVDSELDAFLDKGMIKDSNVFGVGFEPALKAEGGVTFPKSGTKKVAKAAAAPKSKPLFGGFGKK